MRCVNCGFDNEPGRQVCLKCGVSLRSEEYVDPYQRYMPKDNYGEARPTVLDASSSITKVTMVSEGNNQPDGRVPLKETVVQKPDNVQQNWNAYGSKEDVLRVQDGLCPKCHRPLNDGFCPSCGYDENKDVEDDLKPEGTVHKTHKDKDEIAIPHVKCEKCQKSVPVIYSFCPYCAAPIPKKTINIFNNSIKEGLPIVEEETEEPRRFSLTPIVGDDQTPQDSRVLELIDGKIILNRDNTAPDNRTITSKEQAEVSLSDDKWYLENRSEYGSTFIAATRPIELQPSDIILIGDQRFRFNPIIPDE